MAQWGISAGPGATCSSAVALGRVAALPSLQESLLCVGLAAWDSGNSTEGQGWCLDPMVGKSVLCQRSGQPSVSAEQRNKTHCGKEIRMLKMLCIILSGDVYCKYMWLLHTAFGTDRLFFFLACLLLIKIQRHWHNLKVIQRYSKYPMSGKMKQKLWCTKDASTPAELQFPGLWHPTGQPTHNRHWASAQSQQTGSDVALEGTTSTCRQTVLAHGPGHQQYHHPRGLWGPLGWPGLSSRPCWAAGLMPAGLSPWVATERPWRPTSESFRTAFVCPDATYQIFP